MTERWVSNEKHYCKYCSLWTSGDKTSINHHETGWKHKNNVQQYLRDAQKKEIQEKREGDKLQRELQQIKHAADISYRKDISNAEKHYKNQASTHHSFQAPPKRKLISQQEIQHPGANAPIFTGRTMIAPSKQSSEREMKLFYLSRGIILPDGTGETPLAAPRTFGIPKLPTLVPPSVDVPPLTTMKNTPLMVPPPPMGFAAGLMIPPPPLNADGTIPRPPLNPDGSIPRPPLNPDGSIPRPPLNADGTIPSFPPSFGISKPPVIEEAISSLPYGEWEEVDSEEERQKNAPVLLVEDSFTKATTIKRNRRPAQSANYEDSEEEDREINLLEKKDSSAVSLYGSSDDDSIAKPIVFKKRKRKLKNSAANGNPRKRKTLTQLVDE